MTKFFAILPVWGRSFVDTFFRYGHKTLASQTVSPSSIGLTLVICTDDQTALYIFENYESQLNLFANVVLLTIKIDPRHQTHRIQTSFYLAGMSYVSGNVCSPDHYIIFLTPDIVLPTTALSSIIKSVDEGMAVGHMLGLRLSDTRRSRQYLDQLLDCSNPNLSTWDIISLAYKYRHPQTTWLTYNIPNRRLQFFCPHIYIKTSTHFYARAFSLFPLFIKLPTRIPRLYDTIDGKFIEKLCIPSDQQTFFDLDNPIVSVDLASPNHFGSQLPLTSLPLSIPELKHVARSYSRSQRKLFQRLLIYTKSSAVSSLDSHISHPRFHDALTLILTEFARTVAPPSRHFFFVSELLMSPLLLIGLKLNRIICGNQRLRSLFRVFTKVRLSYNLNPMKVPPYTIFKSQESIFE